MTRYSYYNRYYRIVKLPFEFFLFISNQDGRGVSWGLSDYGGGWTASWAVKGIRTLIVRRQKQIQVKYN